MSEPASISSGIAERYATAIFEISKDDKSLAKLESNVTDLAAALDDSDEFAELIASPVVPRSEQKAAVMAIADKMGLEPVLKNGLGLMAEKRRLFVLPQLIVKLREMIADALASDGIEEIFKLGEDGASEIDIFGDDYLAKLEKIKLPNTKIKLLQQLHLPNLPIQSSSILISLQQLFCIRNIPLQLQHFSSEAGQSSPTIGTLWSLILSSLLQLDLLTPQCSQLLSSHLTYLLLI